MQDSLEQPDDRPNPPSFATTAGTQPSKEAPTPDYEAPHPPVNSLAYSSDLNVRRSKTEMLAVIANLKENLAWYVEERNRLIEELNAFKREQQARLDMKRHHELDYPE